MESISEDIGLKYSKWDANAFYEILNYVTSDIRHKLWVNVTMDVGFTLERPIYEQIQINGERL